MNIYRPIEDSLKDKVVIVTGGTYGIAKSIVEAFCYAGSRVVFCARSEDKGIKLAEEFSAKYGADCHFMRCDVTDHGDIARMVDATVERHGGIDVLVNCAGFWPEQLPVDEQTDGKIDDLIQLNFVAYYIFCRQALPYIRASQGNVINIGSIIGTIGKEGATLYCSTKGAIEAFTKALAIDEARNGVRVNEVKPGHIKIENYYESLKNVEDPEGFEDYHNGLQLLGRGGDPDEVARAVLFLASEWASFITGVSLNVSGGYELGEGRKMPQHNWETMEIIK